MATERRLQTWENTAGATLHRGTCCSTGRDFTRYSPSSLLAFSAHAEWTGGKRGCGYAANTLWLSRLNLKAFQSQITTKLLVAFAAVWQRNTTIDKNNLLNSFTGKKSRLLWRAHLLLHTCTHSELKSTQLFLKIDSLRIIFLFYFFPSLF